MMQAFSTSTDAEQIAALAERMERFATHLGVDLDVLDVLAQIDRHGVIEWHEQRVAEELDDLCGYLERGEPFPPAQDARGRTLRRHLTAQNSRTAHV
jgi:hypothetical protein